jgi:hypothetical protein
LLAELATLVLQAKAEWSLKDETDAASKTQPNASWSLKKEQQKPSKLVKKDDSKPA